MEADYREKINEDMNVYKTDRLAAAEKRLEDFRKKSKTPEQDIEFGKMLNDYGTLVKNVEDEVAAEQAK